MEWIDETQRSHKHANVLLIGPPKSAKTTGAASAPGLVGMLNADLPNSTEYAHELYGDRIRELVLPRPGSTQGSIKGLLQEVMRSCYPTEGTPVIDTWVLDPVGELHRRLFKELRPGQKDIRNVYGDVAELVEDFCRFMCEAPCNFVIVAHDHPVKDEMNGTFNVQPWTGTQNPAVGRKVLGMVDVIAYTGLIQVEEGGPLESYAQIVPTEGRPVGVRGRFNCLLTEDVLKTGIIPLNLTDWFTRAGKHLGETVETLPQPKTETKTQSKKAA